MVHGVHAGLQKLHPQKANFSPDSQNLPKFEKNRTFWKMTENSTFSTFQKSRNFKFEFAIFDPAGWEKWCPPLSSVSENVDRHVGRRSKF
jgi:hypothetical protein